MREMRWTDQQAAAITAHGHVLLAASAGTGKTTTVVGKILWLLGLDVGVRDSDGEPLPRCPEPCQLEEIAAITFTEKAAYDLKGKLRKEIERSEGAEALRWEIDRASIGTIHAFCGELLRDHSLRLGIDPTFRVLDERETTLQQEEIVRDVLMTALEARDPLAVSLVKRFHLNRRGRARGAVDQVVGVLRDVRWRARRYEEWTRRVGGNRELDPDRLQQLAREDGREEEADALQGVDRAAFDYSAALYRYAFLAQRRWLAWLEDENVRDFDSLILDARRLLTRESTRPALEDIRRRFRILIIDEFQDTDTVQRDIAFAIAGLDGGPGEEAGPGGPAAVSGRGSQAEHLPVPGRRHLRLEPGARHAGWGGGADPAHPQLPQRAAGGRLRQPGLLEGDGRERGGDPGGVSGKPRGLPGPHPMATSGRRFSH
jgi:ATP-dependent exoDNAse (exonuclease V) beta subunit